MVARAVQHGVAEVLSQGWGGGGQTNLGVGLCLGDLSSWCEEWSHVTISELMVGSIDFTIFLVFKPKYKNRTPIFIQR